MGDIVERLRWHREHPLRGTLELVNPDGEQAADEITTLRAEVERLREALEWALDRTMDSDHPHYPFREGGVWKFPYQVSGAGGSGGGIGEATFTTALEAVEAARAKAVGEFEKPRAALKETSDD